MPQTTDPHFPRLAGICNRLAAIMAEHHAFCAAQRRLHGAAAPAFDRDLHARETALRQQAEAVYAKEMLPQLLGGEWRLATRNRRWPGALFDRRARFDREIGTALSLLTDHPLVYRRRGRRGRASWRDSIVIGRPYNTIDRCGRIADAARDAAALLAQFGVTTWIRADLSAWFPGATQLTVLACGLEDDAAARFGFQPIRGGAIAWHGRGELIPHEALLAHRLRRRLEKSMAL